MDTSNSSPFFAAFEFVTLAIMENGNEQEEKSSHLKDKLKGAAQAIIGEIEELAGAVNADPLAQAEGEFNVEVGRVREDAADELDKGDDKK